MLRFPGMIRFCYMDLEPDNHQIKKLNGNSFVNLHNDNPKEENLGQSIFQNPDKWWIILCLNYRRYLAQQIWQTSECNPVQFA